MKREVKRVDLAADLAIVGGGLAGVCAAITAARAGAKVVLVQDRPVLGGNASSEVRLWVLGATSHMGNNNRWAREGGVIDEILVENLYRNPEGNPVVFDSVLLDLVSAEPNITLLLDTAVFETDLAEDGAIRSVRGFCPIDSTLYDVSAPLFADCSGDGIVGFLSGAAFRIGQEARSEFGERYAPAEACRDLLGHSIYFMSKDLGRPVRYIAPSFALDIEGVRKIHRYRSFEARNQACNFWWIEFGGHLDTIHDCRAIKWELWRVVYGVWNYIKNSGAFSGVENLTLEWVGPVPGKRESRRFEGDAMLTQQDVIEQRAHPDAVSFGGWALDHHPVEGVFSENPGCTQWHSRGVYQIPYRTLYSRNVPNLFLGGRLISASHIAFGSTRVMATCAHNAQAVGMAAAICAREGLLPRDLLEPRRMEELQRRLIRAGQFIPGVDGRDPGDPAQSAKVDASSTLRLSGFAIGDARLPLDAAVAMLLPLPEGRVPEITFFADVERPVTLRAELRVSDRPGNFTPDTTLAALEIPLSPGVAVPVPLAFPAEIGTPQYAFCCVMECGGVFLRLSEERVTGALCVRRKFHGSVATSVEQVPPPDSGIERFEFWLPQRRPEGRNLACRIEPPLDCFAPGDATNGIARPSTRPNAWVAGPGDPRPSLRLAWAEPRRISAVELSFDTDFDHPMESVIMGHPERVMPSVAAEFDLRDASGSLLASCRDNHQTRWRHVFAEPIEVRGIEVANVRSAGGYPAAIMEIRCEP
jgi:hypothetical protein